MREASIHEGLVGQEDPADPKGLMEAPPATPDLNGKKFPSLDVEFTKEGRPPREDPTPSNEREIINEIRRFFHT